MEYFEGICVPDSCSEDEVETLVLHGESPQKTRRAVLLSHPPRFTFLSAKLQMGGMSLIPPLPSVLVNETTQELVSIRCLSNTVVPQASDIVCLSVKPLVCSVCEQAVVYEGGTLKYISSSRFVCCVMVAIPLAATLFAAIIRWRRNKEVSPSAESSSLHSELNLYGTMKSEGSSGTEPAPSTMEENSNS